MSEQPNEPAPPCDGLRLERRMGCGRLHDAGWLGDGRVLVATAAAKRAASARR